MTRLFVPVLVGALVLAGPTAAAGPEPASPTAKASKGPAALQGDWLVLGPASIAHLPLMMELTLQESEPTTDDYASARLTAEQQQQVASARRRVALDPKAADVVEMRAALASIAASPVQITAKEIRMGPPGQQDVLPYEIVSADGLQVEVRATTPSGAKEALTFTLPGPGLIMMGPQGQEPLVLRRAAGD